MSEFTPRSSVLHAELQRACAEKAKSIPCDGLILDLEDAVAPDAKPAAREAACAAAASGEYGRPMPSRSASTGSAPSGTTPTSRPRRRPGPPLSSSRRWAAPTMVRGLVDALERHGAPDHDALGDDRDPGAILDALAIARASQRLSTFVMGTNDLVRSCTPSTSRARPILPAAHRPASPWRAAGIAILDGVYNDVKGHRRLPGGVPPGHARWASTAGIADPPGRVEGAPAGVRPVGGRRSRTRAG